MHWFCNNKKVSSIKFQISWSFIFDTRIKRIRDNFFIGFLIIPIVLIVLKDLIKHIFLARIFKNLKVSFLLKAMIHIPFTVSLNSEIKISGSLERFQRIKFWVKNKLLSNLYKIQINMLVKMACYLKPALVWTVTFWNLL